MLSLICSTRTGTPFWMNTVNEPYPVSRISFIRHFSLEDNSCSLTLSSISHLQKIKSTAVQTKQLCPFLHNKNKTALYLQARLHVLSRSPGSRICKTACLLGMISNGCFSTMQSLRAYSGGTAPESHRVHYSPMMPRQHHRHSALSRYHIS